MKLTLTGGCGIDSHRMMGRTPTEWFVRLQRKDVPDSYRRVGRTLTEGCARPQWEDVPESHGRVTEYSPPLARVSV